MESHFHLYTAKRENKDIFNTYTNENEEAAFQYLTGLYEKYLQGRPITIEDTIALLSKTPDYLLVYLMVEIKKMISEKGCFKFAEREHNCLIAFFKAFSTMLNDVYQKSQTEEVDLYLSESLVKQLHKICTDKDMVAMEQIEKDESGEYRKKGNALIALDFTQVSTDGLLQLIQFITQGPLTSMIIGRKEDYDEFERLRQMKSNFKDAAEIINGIDIIDLANPKAISDSINQLDLFQTISEEEIPNYFTAIEFNAFNRIINAIDDLIIVNCESEEQSDDEQESKAVEQKLSEEELGQLKKIKKGFKNAAKSKDLTDIFQAIKNAKQNSTSKKILEAIAKDMNQLIEEIQKEENNFRDTHLICNTSLNNIINNYQATSTNQLAAKLKDELIQEKGKFVIQFPDPKDIESLMTNQIKYYNNHVHAMVDKTLDEKIHFFCQHLQLCLLIHPFADGNNRVFLNVMDNCLGLLFGVPLKIHFDPFAPYAHSLEEFIDSTKLACANFLALHDYINTKNDKFFKFAHLDKDFSQEQRILLEAFVAPLNSFFQKLEALEQIKIIDGYFQSYLSEQQAQSTHSLFKSLPQTDKQELELIVSGLKACNTKDEISSYLGTKIKSYACDGNNKIADLCTHILSELSKKGKEFKFI